MKETEKNYEIVDEKKRRRGRNAHNLKEKTKKNKYI